MKGLAELMFGPSRHFTLCGRRLAGRFSRDTDLKGEKEKVEERGSHNNNTVKMLTPTVCSV